MDDAERAAIEWRDSRDAYFWRAFLAALALGLRWRAAWEATDLRERAEARLEREPRRRLFALGERRRGSSASYAGAISSGFGTSVMRGLFE